MKLRGTAYTVISSVFFGILPIFVKFALNTGLKTNQIILIRFSFAALFLFLYLLPQKKDLRVSRKQLLVLVFCAVVGYMGMNLTLFIAGLAGAFYAHFVGVLTPKVMHTSNTIEVMAMAYLGGRGSIWGGFLAAIVFIPLLEYLKFLAEYRLIIYGILLVAVMIFYPDGFSGFVTNKLKKTKFGIFCRNLLHKLSPVKAKS
jgi:hypothetical protein